MNPPGSSTSPVIYVCRYCRTDIGRARDLIGRMTGTDYALFHHRVTNLLLDLEELEVVDAFTVARARCSNCPNQLGGQIVHDAQPRNGFFSSVDKFYLNLKWLLTWDGTALRYADTNLVCRTDEDFYKYLCRGCDTPISRREDFLGGHPTQTGYAFFDDNLINVEVDDEYHQLEDGFSFAKVYCINIDCRRLLGCKVICDAQPQDEPYFMLNGLVWWDGMSEIRYPIADTNVITPQ